MIYALNFRIPHPRPRRAARSERIATTTVPMMVATSEMVLVTRVGAVEVLNASALTSVGATTIASARATAPKETRYFFMKENSTANNFGICP